MASINFGPFGHFGENWFKNTPNPFRPPNLAAVAASLNLFKPSQTRPLFASISTPTTPSKLPQNPPENESEDYMEVLEQFFWECDTVPDHRHTPEVEEILNDDPFFDKKENPTPEEITDNDKLLEEFQRSPVAHFIRRAEEVADKVNERELRRNSIPMQSDDAKLWEALPHVIGPDGRPMPRRAIKSEKEADNRFWDFFKQFLFGLWGFRQRPYPSGRPIDITQVLGTKKLENRYYDFIMRNTGGWYYKDRLGHSRGPMQLIQLKTAWAGGIIDKHTFVWGEDLDEWAPIGMIYGMERAVATWEVRLGAAATAFLHKLQKGIPPWVPLKGHEKKKSYKQLQEEAIESKRRDLAVLEANDGIWPGVRIPSHAMFLWASGTELSSILDADHMPNKFIPKDLRLKLAKVIPGLRPSEILSVEQLMDQLLYSKWYREPLGTYSTGPPYIQEWNEYILERFDVFNDLATGVCADLVRGIPGFDMVFRKVGEDISARVDRRLARKAEKLRALDEKAFDMYRKNS
ncbi:protein TIC 56, chloroplastic-like [Actinidia eriantha]|uniref:protein TIC 56, chloroplastic-like n=1 Tax=Actinidia eriantha TaxID=165200 RepID=UPI002590DC5A|nr:protein TIC 56, chloroplastic-like [Actinidia eriantha]